jgi:hypothetical protein
MVELRGVTGKTVAPSQGSRSSLMVQVFERRSRSILAVGLGRALLAGMPFQPPGEPDEARRWSRPSSSASRGRDGTSPRLPERSSTGVAPRGCLRPIDRLQQGSAAERLIEKSDRPRLERACANFGVRVCRDEDDWNRRVGCGEMPLKLQPVHSRQTDVEDQTRGVVSRWRGKKSLRGRENLGGQIGRIHQARQGVSNRWIVIDDGDRKVLRHAAKRSVSDSGVRHGLAEFHST